MTINGAVGGDGHEEKRLSKDIKLTNFTIPDHQNQNPCQGQSSSQNQSRFPLPSSIQNRPKKPIREKLKEVSDREKEGKSDNTKQEPQAHGSTSSANNLNLNSNTNTNQNVNVPSAPLFYWENFGGPKQMSRRPNSNIDYSQESSNQVKMNSQQQQQQTSRKDADADEDEEQDDSKSPLRRQRQNQPDNNRESKESNLRINGLQQHYNYESSRHPPPRYYFDTNSDNNYCYSPTSKLPLKRIAIGLGILSILLLIFSISLTIVFFTSGNKKDTGENSLTEIMSGHAKPNQVIFFDDFDSLNLSVWRHERFLSKDGFVIYSTLPNNSYVENGVLYIEPTLTSKEFNETFLQRGTIKMGQNFERMDGCSSFSRDECERTARGPQYYHILNPIMSASLRTSQSFTFKYGTVEMRAQMPKGDWIWTEISLMPRFNYYGEPTNTEKISLISTRGNSIYRSTNNQSDFGNNRICSKLIYSDTETEAIGTMSEFCKEFSEKGEPGFAAGFHKFKYEWTPDFLKIFIDDKMIGKFVVVVNSFVRSSARHVVIPGDSEHPESMRGRSFDQQFYIQLRVHVGVGFPDLGFRGSYPKPWRNDPSNSGRAPWEFWSSRHAWQPSWRNQSSALQVDYIRVTSLAK